MITTKSRIVRVQHIMRYMDCQQSSAYRLMNNIRMDKNLRKRCPISVSHFCEYMGIDEEEYFKGI
jgi:hypothetical protein